MRCSQPCVGVRVGGDSLSVGLPQNASPGVELLGEAVLLVVGNASDEDSAALLSGVTLASVTVFPESGGGTVLLVVDGFDVVPVRCLRVDRHLQYDVGASRIHEEVFSHFSVRALLFMFLEHPATAGTSLSPVANEATEVLLNLFPVLRAQLLLFDLGHGAEGGIPTSTAKNGESVGLGEVGNLEAHGALGPSDNRPIVGSAWGGEVPLDVEVGCLACLQVYLCAEEVVE